MTTKSSDMMAIDMGLLAANEPAVFELGAGITAEEMRTIFFAPDALLEQPRAVYRVNGSGHRYYYTFDENGEPQFYVSVTTLIKQTMPTSPYLVKWIADKGYEEAQRFAADRAAYGTFMHAQIAELCIARTYDLNLLQSRLKHYIDGNALPADFINYADEFKKDLLSFAQFMLDTNLTPLAIELVLINEADGYGGAVDLVADFDIEETGYWGEVYKSGERKGEPKATKQIRRVRGIIDFKSGRKGFYEEHQIQLAAYREMWNLNYPDYPVERVYNWAPKDWRNAPAYLFTDQTDSPNAWKLPHLIQLARIEDGKRDNMFTACAGKIDLRDGTLDGNITTLSLAEVVKVRTPKDETPGEDVDAVEAGESSPNNAVNNNSGVLAPPAKDNAAKRK